MEGGLCVMRFGDLQKLCRHRHMNTNRCGIRTSGDECDIRECPFVEAYVEVKLEDMTLEGEDDGK